MSVAASPQIHAPGHALQPRHGFRHRLRQRRDAPARRRGDRLCPLLRGQFAGAPAPQQEAGDAGLLRRQLQAPCRRQRDRADLADDGGGGAAAQGLLQRPADLRVALGADQDQAPQVEAESGQAGGVEVFILGHPNDPARPRIGLQAQRQEGGADSTLFLVAALARHFVHRTGLDTGFPQSRVDGRHTETQQCFAPTRAKPRGGDGRDAPLQLRQVKSRGHRITSEQSRCSSFVLVIWPCQRDRFPCAESYKNCLKSNGR